MTRVADGPDGAICRPLRTLDLPGFRLRESLYAPGHEIPAHPHEHASLCLVVEGGYQEHRERARLRLGPASLVFHPPGEVHSDRISELGSRCFTIAIHPRVFRDASDAVPTLTDLHAARNGPPSWLAFQLRTDLYAADDVAGTSIESAVFALLADLASRPGLEARGAPPPWLDRVKEQIHDEFASSLTLGALAHAAGVHRVHVARAFRGHYGCTVGEYIRQRRVEFATERLMGSDDPLSQIAFDAGFADQSHLTNTFRRLVGLTPAVFRMRFRADPPHHARRVRHPL